MGRSSLRLPSAQSQLSPDPSVCWFWTDDTRKQGYWSCCEEPKQKGSALTGEPSPCRYTTLSDIITLLLDALTESRDVRIACISVRALHVAGPAQIPRQCRPTESMTPQLRV